MKFDLDDAIKTALKEKDKAALAGYRSLKAKVMNKLTEREHTVLTMRYGLDSGVPHTLDEVGQHFNLTRERIRQIEAKALAKLRHPSAPGSLRHLLSR